MKYKIYHHILFKGDIFREAIRKSPIVLFLGLSLNLASYGQKKVSGKLTTSDTIQFTIVSTLPDSFPAISVIFKGYKSDGEPLWNLNKEDFKVYENKKQCAILSMSPISHNRPINLSIVVDHSGSMKYDDVQLYDLLGSEPIVYDDVTGELIPPEGFISPIENAKRSTKEFIESFNFDKDFVSITGFSSSVDHVLPLTNNKSRIDSLIDTMHADSLTALYDAMIRALRELDQANGVDVLVTLTDGQNNKSRHSWTDVIEAALAKQVPVFIIGLGNVNRDTLQIIADTTQGKFIYTETSASFSQIYSKISEEIQAFYDLKYESENFSSSDKRRDLKIIFSSGNMLDTMNYTLVLPEEVTAYLHKRKTTIDYAVGGAIVTAVAIGGLTIMIYRRKRNKKRT